MTARRSPATPCVTMPAVASPPPVPARVRNARPAATDNRDQPTIGIAMRIAALFHPLLAGILVTAPVITSAATRCTATSGATIPAIVELYTSEGCDSCPPADRWLATLGDAAARGIVLPLAFHIDYWDYLGW